MTPKQNIKAELKIVLQADKTIIAESSDPILWQNVLAAINTPSAGSTNDNLGNFGQSDKGSLSPAKGPEQELAKEIGVSVEVLKGACSPSNDAPFIHLDKHHWEAFKKGTPNRGPKAIAAIALAATLLILWKEKAKLGDSTMEDSKKVLGTLNLTDKNPDRAIKNCEWLQLRNNVMGINPAQTSKAIAIAKAYCAKTWEKQ